MSDLGFFRLPRARAAAIIGASLLLSLAFVGPAAASSVTPVFVSGNPYCADEGGSGPDLGFDNGIKIDPPKAGTFDVGPGTVTISNVDTSVNPATFTWTSSGVTIAAVVVKGGDGANVYYYNPPPTTTDSGLHAPNGFSHINICWNDQPPPPKGSLKITKVVSGAPQGFTGTFDVHVDCGQAGTFDRTISWPAPGSVTIDDILAGAQCTVTETDRSAAPSGYTWAQVQITGSPATITADGTANVTATNPLTQPPPPPPAVLEIEKTNDAPLELGLPTVSSGATVTYTLTYTLQNGPVDNGVITDVLPTGVTYTNGTATNSANGEFVFAGYDPGTRTLTWTAVQVTAGSTVTYRATIDSTAAALPQPRVNTATIDSDDTPPDSDTSHVYVFEPPKGETNVPTGPPTDLTASGRTDGPGGSMLVVLFALIGLAGVALVIVPARTASRRPKR